MSTVYRAQNPNRRSSAAAIAAASLLFALILTCQALAARGDTLLVSRASGVSGVAGDGPSAIAKMSGDGRFVAFQSDADNLSADDDDAYSDIFLRDLQTGATTLVSRANGPAGAGGNGGSDTASISADGRFVAFTSSATNLSPDDSDALTDVFVRDTQAGTTTLVSRADGPAGAKGSDNSSGASITADGRHVAFSSFADNLSADANGAFANGFIRDTSAGTTTLVSRANGVAGAGGDGSSGDGSPSVGGRHVAFVSGADNLSTDDNNAFVNAFVRDTQAGTTTFVSRDGLAGAAGDAGAANPAITDDGRFVAFHSFADNLSTEDNPGIEDVFMRNLQTGAMTLVSRSGGPAGAAGDGSSHTASISADGRFVSFQSDADNFSEDDDNTRSNVFVRDVVAGTTTLVSRANGEGGAGANDDSYTSGEAISDDGRFAAFESGADNLSGEDNDAFSNVFVRDVLGSPPGPIGAPATADTTAPVGSRLTFKPRSFAAERRGASIARRRAKRSSRVSYRLSEAATVTFRAERRLNGKRKGKRCVTGKRARRLKGRRCTKFKRVKGSFTHAGRAGANRFRFRGRIANRSLKRGRYRLVGRPRDTAGNRGKVFRGAFRIVRR